MSNFNKTMVKVFRHEGGYVNDRQDPGGATNFGITHRTLAKWRKEKITPFQVKAMKKEEAKDIYRFHYWNRMRLDDIEDDDVAGAIMDMGVNSGTKQGIKILQRALNDVSQGRKTLKVDGIIGLNTIRATNSAPSNLLLAAFFLERARFYVGICKRRPASRKFLYAWMRRSVDYV